MFIPEYYTKSVYEIDFSKYPKLKVVLFDIDNTLIAHYAQEPDDNIKRYINKLKSQGYQVYLFSNGKNERIQKIAKMLDVNHVEKAMKPSTKILDKFLYENQYQRDEVVIVGDQVFADILCGNIGKIHNVLVDPISKDEPWFIKLKRIPEALIRKISK